MVSSIEAAHTDTLDTLTHRLKYRKKTRKMAASMKTEQQSPSKSSSSSSQALATNQQSPRNMAKSGSGSTAGTYVSMGPLIVSKALQDGEKFVKWDEVSVCYFLLSHSIVKYIQNDDDDVVIIIEPERMEKL